MDRLKNIAKRNEFFVCITIVAICLVIGGINPVFFTATNIVDLLKSTIVSGIMACAVMLGIVSGGIDVSFPAIACVSMFMTTRIAINIKYEGSIIVLFIISAGFGLLLGLINGLIISKFKLNAFIVTLGTSSIFSGLLTTTYGGKVLSNLPEAIINFSKASLYTAETSGARSSLPISFLIFIGVIIFVFILLKYTMLGRGIYAIGGDRVSAERIGFNVPRIQVFVYSMIGMLAGIAGFCHVCMMRTCTPLDLMGTELLIIAAVILGGAKISGGTGSVLGTILGILLIVITKNSLILVGIPSTWQRFFLGIIIVGGTGITAYQALRRSEKPAIIFDESDEEELKNA